MVQCYVSNCKNRSDCQNWKRTNNVGKNWSKKTFHSVPKNDTCRNLWIDILGLPPNISNTARICSDHFPWEAFDDTNPLRIRLRPNVLPFKVITKEIERKEEDSFIACSYSSVTDKATMTIQPFIEEKATMVIIRDLQQTIRRRDKQIAILKDVLDMLQQKRLLEAEQGEVLFSL